MSLSRGAQSDATTPPGLRLDGDVEPIHRKCGSDVVRPLDRENRTVLEQGVRSERFPIAGFRQTIGVDVLEAKELAAVSLVYHERRRSHVGGIDSKPARQTLHELRLARAEFTEERKNLSSGAPFTDATCEALGFLGRRGRDDRGPFV